MSEVPLLCYYCYFQVALVQKYHTNGVLYTSFQSQTLRYLKHDFAFINYYTSENTAMEIVYHSTNSRTG